MNVATAPTACGIETSDYNSQICLRIILPVATAPTACGIETLKRQASHH